MRTTVIAALLAIAICAHALPIHADETWVCVWGDPKESGNRAFEYTLKGNTLTVDQTGDTFRVLENNEYGIVATGSMSEFVPIQKKPIIAFFSMAIDKSTGKSLRSDGVIGEANEGVLSGTCTKRPSVTP